MLTGKVLGDAIRAALKKKGVTQKALAAHFDVQPPSVHGWLTTGTIGKEKLVELWRYFAPEIGPEHWGLDEFPAPGIAQGFDASNVTAALTRESAPTPYRIPEALEILEVALLRCSQNDRKELQKLFDLYLGDPVRYSSMRGHIQDLLLGEPAASSSAA